MMNRFEAYFDANYTYYTNQTDEFENHWGYLKI